jgi:hypothetical protein
VDIALGKKEIRSMRQAGQVRKAGQVRQAGQTRQAGQAGQTRQADEAGLMAGGLFTIEAGVVYAHSYFRRWHPSLQSPVSLHLLQTVAIHRQQYRLQSTAS